MLTIAGGVILGIVGLVVGLWILSLIDDMIFDR